MNIKNFPKKLDSKTSYLRITVPENLDLALEGLIRKVLREQPDTEDIYAFAADYFETLLSIRDKSGHKAKLSEANKNLNDKEMNEMTLLANSFPRPSLNEFSCSPVKNKGKRKKNSAKNLVKLNSFEEKENIKPKTVESKTKLEIFNKKKLGKDDNLCVKDFTDANIMSDLSKTVAVGIKQISSNLNLDDSTKENDRSEAETGSETAKQESSYIEDNEEFLASDPIKELVEQELLEKAAENNANNTKLSQVQQNITENETENDESEKIKNFSEKEFHMNEDNLEEEDKLKNLKDEIVTNEVIKNESEVEIVEKKIENDKIQDVSLEKDSEKLEKENDEFFKKEKNAEKPADNVEESADSSEISTRNEENIVQNKNDNDDNTSQNLNIKESSETAGTEKTDLQEENQQKNIENKIINGETLKALEKEDEIKNKELTSDNEVSNIDNVLETADKQLESTDGEKESKENLDMLTESEKTEKEETENLNNLLDLENVGDENLNKNDEVILDDKIEEKQVESKESESISEKEEKSQLNEEEKSQLNEEEKKDDLKTINLQPQNSSEISKEEEEKERNLIKKATENFNENIVEEGELLHEKENYEKKVYELENFNKETETTEEEGKNFNETNGTIESKNLIIENEEKNVENSEIVKKGSTEESAYQHLKDENMEEDSVQLSPTKESDSKKLEDIKDNSDITDNNLNSQIPTLSDKEQSQEASIENTQNKRNSDDTTFNNMSAENIKVEESKSDETDDTKNIDESKNELNTLENETKKFTETSADSMDDNKSDINGAHEAGAHEAGAHEAGAHEAGALEDNEKKSGSLNEIEKETKIDDADGKEIQSKNFQEVNLDEQKQVLKSSADIEKEEKLDFVEDSQSVVNNNEELKKIQKNENLENEQVVVEEVPINETAPENIDKNKINENENLLEEKLEKLEENANNEILGSRKVDEINDTLPTNEKEELTADHENETMESSGSIETSKENENMQPVSEINPEEQFPIQTETPKLKRWVTIDRDSEMNQEISEKLMESQEILITGNENDFVKTIEKDEDKEKIETSSENNNIPDEELCSVVDINEIRRVQEADEMEKLKKEDVKEEELSAVVDRIQVTPVEEETNDIHKNLPEDENLPLKTIKTHYYDFLRIPETNIKEYRVKPVTEYSTLAPPQKNAPSVIKAYQFQREEPGRELWTLVENTGTPKDENKIELNEEPPEIDDLMTPSSVTSMAVSEMSAYSINETFLDSERLHSSYEKKYQSLGKIVGEGNQSEGDNPKEEKKEVEEAIEKKSVAKIVAVPLPPRESDETIEEENEELETFKNPKEKLKKKNLPFYHSRDSFINRSVDSDNFAFISVDIETVIGTQELDEDEMEESENSTKFADQVSTVKIEVETEIGILQDDKKKGSEQESQMINENQLSKNIQMINNKELSLTGNDQIDLDQSSVETTETTSSSALTEIKRLDSLKKSLTRGSTQNFFCSQSFDKNIKIDEFVKKKSFVKTRSLGSLSEGITDTEIWKKIENELEEAATKIQSHFRSYRKKKKLQRENAIQVNSESSRSITPVEPEVQHQQASGEFHDSIVLSVIPR